MGGTGDSLLQAEQRVKTRTSTVTAGGILSSRQRRVLREYLTGYLMILPAGLLVFLFGLFPVGFALYVSLQKWRLKRGEFLGLANYAGAIGNLAYLGAFAFALAALFLAWRQVRRVQAEARERGERPWILALPGVLYAATALAFLRWAVLLLPVVLDIADKIVGKRKTRELFVGLLGEAFRAESVLPAWRLFLALAVASLLVGALILRFRPGARTLLLQAQWALAWFSGAVGVILLRFTLGQVAAAYGEAAQSGADPGIWPQVVIIGSGVILLGMAWKVWAGAPGQASALSFGLRLLAAVALLVGGWLLIGELPAVLAAGDEELWSGLKVTAFYSLGTIPFQLIFALFLAVLLFQKLRGSEFFRMLFFLPYVTPAVASAAVFRQLFSERLQAPVNQFLRLLGLPAQQWLREPEGIFSMLAQGVGLKLQAWAGGPSLALVVIMIFSIWTFVGYDTVIYLAGLGNIDRELVESAEIDGASQWQTFRFIILPLLSPTTYFLTLIAVIGTFKAFNHIWVMRDGAALGTSDTFSVLIFSEFFEKLRYGYASALAFVLFAVIISLTYINNRVQGSRVFYG